MSTPDRAQFRLRALLTTRAGAQLMGRTLESCRSAVTGSPNLTSVPRTSEDGMVKIGTEEIEPMVRWYRWAGCALDVLGANIDSAAAREIAGFRDGIRHVLDELLKYADESGQTEAAQVIRRYTHGVTVDT